MRSKGLRKKIFMGVGISYETCYLPMCFLTASWQTKQEDNTRIFTQ